MKTIQRRSLVIATMGYTVLLYTLVSMNVLSRPTDMALRINQNIDARFSPHISGHAWMFEHMNQSMSRFEYYETGIGPRFHPSFQWMTVCFLYRQAFSKKPGNIWQIEKSPSANVEFSLGYRRIKIWHQTRFEYRFTPNWRNLRVKSFLKTTLSGFSMAPYVAWESFYEHQFRAFQLQRFFAGITAPLTGSMSVCYYVRLDIQTDDAWDLYRICLGIKLIFQFASKSP